MSGIQFDNQMKMVGHASDLNENTFFFFDNSGDISIKVIANGRDEQWFTIFRAENHMIYEI